VDGWASRSGRGSDKQLSKLRLLDQTDSWLI
jgi:hypothetical protein